MSSPIPIIPEDSPASLFLDWRLVYWATVAILAVVYVAVAIVRPYTPYHFIYLAHSFSSGKLSVDHMPLIYPDYVVWQEHIYIPMGPLPAVLLIPFLPLIDLGLKPVWIGFTITLANILVFYLICGKIGIRQEKRLWMLLFFFGGTVYFSLTVTMNAWYFGQIVAITWLLLAIMILLYQRNTFLVGLCVGLAASARLSLVFALIFFLYFYWPTSQPDHQTTSWIKRWNQVIYFMIGLCIPLTLLLLYNQARFGNPFETGYGKAVLGSLALEQAREQGLFSIVHIPKNIHFLLLQGPIPYPALDAPVLNFPYVQPSPQGMAIFFTSPALLYAFRAKLKDTFVKTCWLTILLILIPLITYYGVGWIQFGYRYSLDLMPFLVLLVARGLPTPLTNRARSLIILSVLINLWGTAWLQTWL